MRRRGDLRPTEFHGRGSQRFVCKNCKKFWLWTSFHSKPGRRLVERDRVIICDCGVKHYR